MDKETDQQQNDDYNNDSSARHLPRYLPRFASFQKSAHRQKSYPIPPSPPPVFSQVLILKGVKVVCFDTLLQVLILKELVEEQFRGRMATRERTTWEWPGSAH